MGETGPCGPCTEIHIDLRPDEERKKLDGKQLVNESHPQVIEVWNNVFMEFLRKADGSLEKLPAQHVDTGMGFERLCMALQGKTSNYDTDVFQPLIQHIAKAANKIYGESEKIDIAMRVMADHIRAISFAIADGQLPSNNKAGYVIRRILRRAVRYQYTFLNFKEPFLNTLVAILAKQFADVFPELSAQQDFITKVILEEENSFLRTLGTGIQKFEAYGNKAISGDFAFELYDTYGFPIDLTQLLARESNLEIDMDRYAVCLEEQKNRSRAATSIDTEDWLILGNDEKVEFVGYDEIACETKIEKYRKVKSKGKEQYQIVLSKTPFYAESGGQVGDTGQLSNANETIIITNTQKENNLIVHFADSLPGNVHATFTASINAERRQQICANHSVTHLLHSALKQVLGNHVAQKGSLVNEDYTRFDFSHFQKVSETEIEQIENIVNAKIREGIALQEHRNLPIAQAMNMGATALFGEKYGENVRVVIFDPAFSIELCGGTHVKNTSQIGLFKIISESSVAAGVRRIEAITGVGALQYYKNEMHTLSQMKELLNQPKDVLKALSALLEKEKNQEAKIQSLLGDKAKQIKSELLSQSKNHNGFNLISAKIDLPSADAIKNLAFELRSEIENLVLVLGAELEGKPHLTVMLSNNLVEDKKLNASNMVRELAKEIQGGGGGQAFYATAGGKEMQGLGKALHKAESLLN